MENLMNYRRIIPLWAVFGTLTLLHAKPVDLNDLAGDWHLRIMDGYDVRKTRAILDFQPQKMKLAMIPCHSPINTIVVI